MRREELTVKYFFYLVDLDNLLDTPRTNIHSSGSPGVHC